MVSNNAKNSVIIRKLLNEGSKHFLVTPYVQENFGYHYKFVQRENRTYQYALGNVCTISDCYILYVISILGVCDMISIRTCLLSLSAKYPELCIADVLDKDVLRKRLRALFKCGYLFKITYNLNMNPPKLTSTSESEAEEEESMSIIALYTLDRDAHTIMNKVLCKNVTLKDWIQVSREREVIGIAASSYITSCMTKSPYFINLLDGCFRTKEVGTSFMDSELRFQRDNKDYYVGTIHMFLHRDDRIMTEDDYYEYCTRKLNVIKNYLYIRNKKGKSRVICVCESNDDLVSISKMILVSGAFPEHLDHIFFTGEGAVRSINEEICSCMLQIDAKMSTPEKVVFTNGEPTFLK